MMALMESLPIPIVCHAFVGQLDGYTSVHPVVFISCSNGLWICHFKCFETHL